MTVEELKQIKIERDEMDKHMTDMFDLAFMINNHDDLAKSQEHHEKLSRMVTHYMGSIQQSYGYMSEKAIEALEQDTVSFDFELYEAGMMSMPKEMIKVIDKIRAEINQITDTMGVSYNQYVSKIDVLKIIDKYKAEQGGGRMTRENLLRYGKEYLRDLETACCEIGELHLNFVRESIKALEREPCTDAVSRQTVKEQMIKYGFLAPDMTVTEFVEDELPPVTPKPKTGEWIEHRHYDGVSWEYSTFECTNCHETTMAYTYYCPNCGARMVESQEGEDKK